MLESEAEEKEARRITGGVTKNVFATPFHVDTPFHRVVDELFHTKRLLACHLSGYQIKKSETASGTWRIPGQLR
jgi:hypothetical protein